MLKLWYKRINLESHDSILLRQVKHMSSKRHKPNMRLVSILLLSVAALALVSVFQTAKAATITSATPNKETYLAGQTGYISATIYNDETQKIRVTELSGIVDYFYTDGTAYVQRFFTNADLPAEIQPGQSETIQIPISLPTNIASGYVNLRVEAKTEL